MTFDGTLNYV